MSLKISSTSLMVLAVLASGSLVTCKRGPRRWSGPSVKVLVAAAPIKPRTPLTVDVVEERNIPEEFYTDSMLTPGDLEINRRRLLVHRIEKGQPIYFHNLEGQETDKSLGQKLRPGGRAYTVAVNEVSGGGYWIQPNDHVDVLATVPRRVNGQSEPVTITLLENIIVLKVGAKGKNVNDPDGQDFSFGSVTLLVLPEEAELLNHAETTGRLGLSLRNPDDRGLMQERAWSTSDTLLTRKRVNASGTTPAPEAPTPAPPPPPPAPAATK